MFATDVKTQNPLKARRLKQTHMHYTHLFYLFFFLLRTQNNREQEVLLANLKEV